MKKDKQELEHLRDLLKRFFDHDYKRTFILFPPKYRRSKRNLNWGHYEDSKSIDSNS